jgi:hypothetical protein
VVCRIDFGIQIEVIDEYNEDIFVSQCHPTNFFNMFIIEEDEEPNAQQGFAGSTCIWATELLRP